MNKQIEELALKVAQQRYVEQHSGTGEGINFSNYAEFAKAFLAELAKQSEPVGEVSAGTHVFWENDSVPLAGTKLYLHPLPRADLVAEIERLKKANDYHVINSKAVYEEATRLKLMRDDLLKKNNTLSNTASCLERQLIAAQADNEQLVKALIEFYSAWTVGRTAVDGTAVDIAIAAHKARQGKEES